MNMHESDLDYMTIEDALTAVDEAKNKCNNMSEKKRLIQLRKTIEKRRETQLKQTQIDSLRHCVEQLQRILNQVRNANYSRDRLQLFIDGGPVVDALEGILKNIHHDKFANDCRKLLAEYLEEQSKTFVSGRISLRQSNKEIQPKSSIVNIKERTLSDKIRSWFSMNCCNVDLDASINN